MSSKCLNLLSTVVGKPVSNLEPGKLVTEADVIKLWMFLSSENNSPVSSPNHGISALIGEKLLKHWEKISPSAEMRKKVTNQVHYIIGKAVRTMKFTSKLSDLQWIQSQKERFQRVLDVEASKKRPSDEVILC